MVDRTLIETTSPKEAAKGVAKLSGFILHLYEIMMTAIITKSVRKERFNETYVRYKISR